MSDPVRVQLNLNAIRENLSRVEGRQVGVEDAKRWLDENGFLADGEDWLAIDYDCLGLLEKSELIRYEPIPSDGVLSQLPV